MAFGDYAMILPWDSDKTKAKKYFDIGTDFILKKDYASAILNLNKSIAYNPKEAKYYIQRGAAYYYSNMQEQALLDYTTAIGIDKTNDEYYGDRAQINLDLNNDKAAVNDILEAIKICPKELNYWLLLIDIYEKMKNFKEIQSVYEKILSEFSNKSKVITQIKNKMNSINETIKKSLDEALVEGKELIDKEEYEKAIDILEEAKLFNITNNSDCFYLCGLAKYWNDQEEVAIIDLTVAINIAPKADYYYYRGHSNYLIGNYKYAIEDFKLGIKMKPENIYDFYNLMADAKVNNGDLEGAKKDYQKALQLNPTKDDEISINSKLDDVINKILNTEKEKAEEYFSKAKQKRNNNEYDAAIKYLKKSINLLPGNPTYHYWIGLNYYDNTQYQDAIISFKDAIEIDAKNADSFYWCGMSEYNLKNYKAAIDYLDKGIDLSPDDIYWFYYQRGRAKYWNDQDAEAIVDFEKAISSTPEKNEDYYYWCGNARYYIGDYQNAIIDFDNAIDIANEEYYYYYENRGNAKNKLGDLHGAIEDLSKAIELTDDIDKQSSLQQTLDELHEQILFKEEKKENVDILLQENKPKRVPWNKHEVALLIDLYLKIENDKIARDEGISYLSNLLRQQAEKTQSIDEYYRNTNGVGMKLEEIRYCFTDGEKGLKNYSNLEKTLVDMQKEQPKLFEKILNEAQEKFDNFNNTSNSTKISNDGNNIRKSPAQILDEIEDIFKSEGSINSLLEDLDKSNINKNSDLLSSINFLNDKTLNFFNKNLVNTIGEFKNFIKNNKIKNLFSEGANISIIDQIIDLIIYLNLDEGKEFINKTRVKSFNLSPNATSCLYKLNYFSLEDIRNFKSILYVNGAGPATIEEIYKFLQLQNHNAIQKYLNSTPLFEYDISTKAKSALYKAGKFFAEDLKNVSIEKLYSNKNITISSLDEIIKFLLDNDINFNDDLTSKNYLCYLKMPDYIKSFLYEKGYFSTETITKAIDNGDFSFITLSDKIKTGILDIINKADNYDELQEKINIKAEDNESITNRVAQNKNKNKNNKIVSRDRSDLLKEIENMFGISPGNTNNEIATAQDRKEAINTKLIKSEEVKSLLSEFGFLSKQSINYLNKRNCYYIEDLVGLDDTFINENEGVLIYNEVLKAIDVANNRILEDYNSDDYINNNFNDYDIPPENKPMAVLDNIYISNLLLSKRLTNILLQLNIHTVGDLVKFPKRQIYNAKNFGINSFYELRDCLLKYKIDIPDFYDARNNIDTVEETINFDDVMTTLAPIENNKVQNGQETHINSNLYTLIKDIDCDDCIKQFCYDLNIYKIGQLTEYDIDKIIMTNEQFLSIDDFKTKYTKFIEQLSLLGITEWPAKYPIHRQDLYEYTLNELIDIGLINCLYSVIKKFYFYLSPKEKNIIYKRLELGETLNEIGKECGVSRERIRQIQDKAIEKIVKNNFYKNFQAITNTCFNEFGCIYAYEENDKSKLLKHIFKELENNKKNSFNSFYFDDNFNFIVQDKEWLSKFYNNILKILSNNEISREKLKEILIMELDKLLNKTSNKQQENYNTIINLIFTDFVNKYTLKIDSNLLKILDEIKLTKKDTVISNIKKDEIIIVFKNKFPNGVHLPQDKEHLLIKNLKPLTDNIPYDYSIRGLCNNVLINSEKVILWGKGIYIHIDNINVQWEKVDKIINDIIAEFDNGKSHFSLKRIYEYYIDDINAAGIPNIDALLGLIKYKNNPRIGNKKYELFDVYKEGDSINKTSIIEKYIKNKNEWVSQSVLYQHFCDELGWETYQVDQYASNSKEIFKDVNLGFIHRTNLLNYLNKDVLRELVEDLMYRLQCTDSVRLADMKRVFRKWKDIFNYDVTGGVMCNLIDSLPITKELPVYFYQGHVYKKDFTNSEELSTFIKTNYMEKKLSKMYKEFRKLDEQNIDTIINSNINITTVLAGKQFEDIIDFLYKLEIHKLGELLFFPFDNFQIKKRFKPTVIRQSIDAVISWTNTINTKNHDDDIIDISDIFWR